MTLEITYLGVSYASTYKWTEQQLQDMISSYTNGETPKAIAKRYGVARPILYPLFKKHGVMLSTTVVLGQRSELLAV